MMIKVDGVQEVQRQLDAIAKRSSAATMRAIMAGAQMVRGDAIRSIQAQSSGKEVTRSREGGATYAHIAASAGEAPNTDTGRLVGSIHIDGSGMSLSVGTPLEYGANLERGTARMSARPFLFPALEKNRDRIAQLITKAASA